MDHDVLQRCANALDAGFNFVYQTLRHTDYIGPLELCIVREGTFEQKMNAAVMRGAAPSQYKTPRCVNNPQALKVLKECTVASFHSTHTLNSAVNLT
jgi:auxin responsive GH3 family protein